MRTLALPAALAVAGCLRPMDAPPTVGYGEPYRGDGQKIRVKDSRTDWDIHEGERLMTHEQALEASKDPEYEQRRQIMKQHDAALYAQAKRHRKLGFAMIAAAAATFVGGLVVSYGIGPHFDNHAITPATAEDPEMDHVTASGASTGLALLGTVMIVGGLAGMGYGYYGAWHQPAYVAWKIPEALDRPAYIRRFTEEYNEALDDKKAAVPAEGLRPPPGVKPPPTLRMRGGRS
jgi:hypothetical protein